MSGSFLRDSQGVAVCVKADQLAPRRQHFVKQIKPQAGAAAQVNHPMWLVGGKHLGEPSAFGQLGAVVRI
jgi:hypothetical protein